MSALPLPMGEVPGQGGEGLFYPLSRLRRQLPQRGSQGVRCSMAPEKLKGIAMTVLRYTKV